MNRQHPGSYPLHETVFNEKQAFPDLCLRYHWDPTRISHWTLPQQSVAMPLDPRPWTKVCLTYTTTSPHQRAPDAPRGLVLPTGGGSVYGPPNQYLASIDRESSLRRLDRPLGISESKQYIPTNQNQSTVPDRPTLPSTRFMSDLFMPKVLLRTNAYTCRQQDDEKNIQRSQLLFHNCTKYQKFKETRVAPQPIPQGMKVNQ